jgi:hypothetical protein
MSSVGSSSSSASRAAQEAERARKAQAKAEPGALEGAAALQPTQPAAKEPGAAAQPHDSFSRLSAASPEEMVEQASRAREARSKHYLNRIKEQFAEGTGKPKKRRGSRQDGAGSTQKAQGTKEAEPAAQLTPELSEKLRLQRGGKAAEEMNASTGESAQGDALTPELREKLRLQRGGTAAEEMNASMGLQAAADRPAGAALPADVAAARTLAPPAAAEGRATEAQLGQALQQAISGTAAEKKSAREMLKKIAASGEKSKDPVVKNLASAASRVLKGLDLLDVDPAKDKFAKFKAVMEFGMAGPDALKAGLEAIKERDPQTAKLLNDMLGGGVAGIKSFTSLCQAMDKFGQGELREGFKHLAECSVDGFNSARWILERMDGVSKEKLDAIEGVLKGGKAAVDKIVKGMDLLDEKKVGPALKEFFDAGGDALKGLIPMLSEAGGKYAAAFGPLVKCAGQLASVAPEMATMLDKSKPYFERLDAAQKALPKVGVEALRLLACNAFGDKAGNTIADGADWLQKKAVEYDQETGKTWKDAFASENKAWNHSIKNGEAIAAVMGFKRGSLSEGSTQEERDDYAKMENFAELWASSDSRYRKEMQRVFNILRAEGPEVARERYFDLCAKWKAENRRQQGK